MDPAKVTEGLNTLWFSEPNLSHFAITKFGVNKWKEWAAKAINLNNPFSFLVKEAAGDQVQRKLDRLFSHMEPNYLALQTQGLPMIRDDVRNFAGKYLHETFTFDMLSSSSNHPYVGPDEEDGIICKVTELNLHLVVFAVSSKHLALMLQEEENKRFCAAYNIDEPLKALQHKLWMASAIANRLSFLESRKHWLDKHPHGEVRYFVPAQSNVPWVPMNRASAECISQLKESRTKKEYEIESLVKHIDSEMKSAKVRFAGLQPGQILYF